MAVVHTEVLLSAGYAVFLISVALVLEAAGRLAHRRAGRFRLASFTYHPTLDVWECPTGERLFPIEQHRYRAHAHSCNSCPLKGSCTDSDAGREIVVAGLEWLETEVGRFHRGMSLGLLVLVAWLVAFEAVRYRDAADLRVLAAVLAIAAALGFRMTRALLRAKG